MKNGEFLVGEGLDANSLLTADTLQRTRGRLNCIPQFRKETIMVDGEPKEIEVVSLLVPGDPKSIPEHLVDDGIKREFSDQYEAWKRGDEFVDEGIDLSLLLGKNSALLYKLKAANIHTLEQLAELDDNQVNVIGMGGLAMRDRARKMIDVQKQNVEFAKQEEKDKEIKDLKSQIAELTALVKGGSKKKAADNGEGEDGDDLEDTFKPPEGAVPVPSDKEPPASRRNGRRR